MTEIDLIRDELDDYLNSLRYEGELFETGKDALLRIQDQTTVLHQTLKDSLRDVEQLLQDIPEWLSECETITG